MKRCDPRAAGVALAVLAATAVVQAQEVHKCTLNGAVTYQAMPCPSGDVVLQAPPTPSEQEARQARTDLSRQRFEAASGRVLRPVYVTPRPAPPPPPPPPPVTTMTTTTTVVVDPYSPPVILRQTTSRTTSTLPQKPMTNCERLDRDNAAALDRRELVRAATDLPAHAQALQQAEDDAARIRQLAAASNCPLTR